MTLILDGWSSSAQCYCFLLTVGLWIPQNPCVFLIEMRIQLSVLSCLVTLIRRNLAKHNVLSKITFFSPALTHVKLANKPWNCVYLMINLCYFVGVFLWKKASILLDLQHCRVSQCCNAVFNSAASYWNFTHNNWLTLTAMAETN